MLIGGGAAVLALLGGLGWLAFGAAASPRATRSSSPRGAIQQVLPSVECSWLDAASIEGGERVAVRMTGVAGNPTAARTQIAQALAEAGVNNADLNFDEVAIIRPQGCSALQTFGKIRKGGAPHMSVAQREFEMTRQPAGSRYPVASQADVTFKPAEGQDFALMGIEPDGELSVVLPNRAAFDEAVAGEAIDAGPARRIYGLRSTWIIRLVRTGAADRRRSVRAGRGQPGDRVARRGMAGQFRRHRFGARLEIGNDLVQVGRQGAE